LEGKLQILFKINFDVIGVEQMEEDELNYRMLRKIQQMEKNSPVLTDLKSNFYIELVEYLENLNNRLEKDISSQKKLLLTEEIQNIKKIAINIYEQREKKIILAAISKGRGGNPDLKNMADKEKNLFEAIINLMLKSRKNVLEIKNERNKLNDFEKVENKDDEKSEENLNSIVRVTKDIPEFIGTDEKKYNLRNNDIVSLPEDMSEMLSKRGVIKKINQ
jgi:DNA replication initiation complex subunit (GINS family)